jgi:hypothetical protein
MGKNQSASNLTNIIKQDASGNISFVSGSTTLMSVSSSGAITTTGNVAGTASYASNAELFDGLDSTVFTLTSSFAAQTASFTAFTASQNILNGTYATTGSNTFAGIQTINSNLIVTGSITAQTLVVQTITSSVDFVTGSTRFGSLSSNTHVFTGSVSISGSSTALNINSGSFFISSSGNVGIGTINPSTRLTISKPIDFAAYGSGSQAIDFKLYFPGFDVDTVKASIYVGVSSIAGLNTQSGYMSFMTSNAGTLAERMRIEKDGTIGIGTTIPSAFIDIRKNVFTPTSTAASVLIEERGTYQMGIEFYIHNAGIYLAGRPSGGVGTCNTAALRIAGGGIINGNFTGGGGVTFIPSTTVGSVLSVGDSDGFMFYTTGSLTAGTGINLANYERMRITSGGNVLIGGTSDIASGALVVGDNSSTRPLIIRGLNGVDAAYTIGIGFYPWNTSESNAILNTVSSAASQSGFRFDVSNGGGSTARTASMYINRGGITVVGSLAKGSGSFRIKHPLASKKNTHQLVHSFIEGPQADLIYRGKIRLNAGKATVNIDEASTMTEGTFEALCREVQCFTTNETGWDNVRGKVTGNILTIESQNTESTDEISWMVVGERQDEHIMDTDWTDSNGKVIVEPLIPEEITTT